MTPQPPSPQHTRHGGSPPLIFFHQTHSHPDHTSPPSHPNPPPLQKTGSTGKPGRSRDPKATRRCTRDETRACKKVSSWQPRFPRTRSDKSRNLSGTSRPHGKSTPAKPERSRGPLPRSDYSSYLEDQTAEKNSSPPDDQTRKNRLRHGVGRKSRAPYTKARL